jgi:hypothetical protein
MILDIERHHSIGEQNGFRHAALASRLPIFRAATRTEIYCQPACRSGNKHRIRLVPHSMRSCLVLCRNTSSSV